MEYRGHIYTRGQKVVISVLALFVAAAAVMWCLLHAGAVGSVVKRSGGFVLAADDSLLSAQVAEFEARLVSCDSLRMPGREKAYRHVRTDVPDAGTRSPAGRLPDGLKPGTPDSAGNGSGVTVKYKYGKKEFFAFDINHADTALLVKLPGIGTVRASGIVKYREKLGGFVSAGQLAEVGILPDSVVEALRPYVVIDSAALRRVPVNRCGVECLRRHPYINYYQARAIYDLRWDSRHNGTLSPDDISRIKEFTAEELERLLPYLDFSEGEKSAGRR
ncbi:MAG: ComEA family DNA-binding protein [Candidatus Aphodosoma sp.]